MSAAGAQPGRAVRLAALLPNVLIACSSCEYVWEPDPDDWETGNTGCPTCGGWTWIAQLAEPAAEAGS